jgi:hypothetical protein
MKSSAALKESYIVERGKKTAAVIPIGQYRNLLKRVEDLEDALDALKAKKTARDFYDYRDVRKGLKAKGKL